MKFHVGCAYCIFVDTVHYLKTIQGAFPATLCLVLENISSCSYPTSPPPLVLGAFALTLLIELLVEEVLGAVQVVVVVVVQLVVVVAVQLVDGAWEIYCSHFEVI